MIKPFFSVVVPTFKRPESLEKVIECVLSQTYSSWELVIIDDGGDEKTTREVLRKFDDSRIRYFWKENEERSIARNYGIRVSRGTYVVPLDSDDRITSTHLEKVFETISEFGDIEFLHTSFVIKDLRRDQNKTCGPYSTAEINRQIIYENIFAIGAGVIRADIARRYPFPESSVARHGEDWIFYLRIFIRFGVQWVNSPSFLYIVNQDSSINNIDPDRFRTSYNMILQILQGDTEVKKYFGAFKFRTMMGYQTLGIALQYLIGECTERRTPIIYVIKSLQLAPWLVTSRRFLVCFKKLAGF